MCDAAVVHLRETGNLAVMWGDCGLLDQIHRRSGLKQPRIPHPLNRHTQVLNALTRQPGELVPGMTRANVSGCGERYVRIFWLPEHAPKRLL